MTNHDAPPVTIRPMLQREIEFAIRVIQRAHDTSGGRYSGRILCAALERYCLDSNSGVLVAEHECDIVATCAYCRCDWSLTAYSLQYGATLPGYRKRGIGALLIAARLERIAEALDGHGRVYVSTREPHLFLRHGFRPLDAEPGCPSHLVLNVSRWAAEQQPAQNRQDDEVAA